MDWTDREAVREYHRNYYRERRRRPMLDYLGGKCVECGTTEGLHFDHIDPAQKSFDISGNLTLSNPEVRVELDKCQLLCKAHHEEKTAEENSGFTHGTVYGWMRKKCGCDDCAKAKRTWYDKRNAERRGEASKRGAYGQPAEHGEILMYRRGCRCGECRAANAAYARSLRLRT